MTVLYLLKLFLTPALLGTAVIAARLWGPVVGGGLVGLPFVSGSGSIVFALEHGPHFASTVAYSSLLGVVAVSAYCLSYAHSARRFSWPFSLACAVAAFAVCSNALKLLPHNLPLAYAAAFAAPCLCLALMPSMPGNQLQARNNSRWRLLTQMACGGLAVFTLTELSGIIGGQWSGLLLTFPIITSILIPFTHAGDGPRAATFTLKGVTIGSFGSSAFSTVIATQLESFGLIAGYLTGFSAAFIASYAVAFADRKLTRRAY